MPDLKDAPASQLFEAIDTGVEPWADVPQRQGGASDLFTQLDAIQGRPEWADERVPVQARVGDFLRTNARAGRSFDEVGEEARNRFGVEPEQLKNAFRVEESRTKAATMEEPTLLKVIKKVPGSGTVAKWALEREYGRATRRIQANEAKDEDFDFTAQYERLQQLKKDQSLGSAVFDTATDLPALYIEAVSGARALQGLRFLKSGRKTVTAADDAFAAAQAGRSTLGAAVAATPRVAGATALAPVFWAEQGARNLNEAKNRDEVEAVTRAYGAAFVYGTVQNAIVGNLLKPREGTRAVNVLKRTPTAMLEQATLDIGAGAVNLNTGYGLVGDILTKPKSEALKTATTQALTFAVFAGLHGRPARKPLEGYTDALDSLKKQGLSEEAAGRKLTLPTPDAPTEQWQQATEALPKGPAREYVRGVWETFEQYREAGLSQEEAVRRAAEVGRGVGKEGVSAREGQGETPEVVAEKEVPAETAAEPSGNVTTRPETPVRPDPLEGLSKEQVTEIAQAIGLTAKGLREKAGEPWVAKVVDAYKAPPEAAPAPDVLESPRTAETPPEAAEPPSTPDRPSTQAVELPRTPLGDSLKAAGLEARYEREASEEVGRSEGFETAILGYGDRFVGVQARAPDRVRLDFDYSDGREGGTKDVPPNLQKGTVGLVKDLTRLAGALKEKGLSVEFSAEPRRAAFYDRVLAKAGFERVEAKQGTETGEYLYRPKVEKALSPAELRIENLRRKQRGLAPITAKTAAPVRPTRRLVETLPEALSEPERQAEAAFERTRYEDVPAELRNRTEAVIERLVGTEGVAGPRDAAAMRESARSAYAAGGREGLSELLALQEQRLSPPEATPENLARARAELKEAEKELSDVLSDAEVLRINKAILARRLRQADEGAAPPRTGQADGGQAPGRAEAAEATGAGRPGLTPEQWKAQQRARREAAAAEAEAKAKAQKQARPKAPPRVETVLKEVRDFGGIDPSSESLKAYFSSSAEAIEAGVPLSAFKKGGRGLDALAQELHSSGRLRSADPQDLIDALVGRKASTGADPLGKAQAARAEEYYHQREEEYYHQREEEEAGRALETLPEGTGDKRYGVYVAEPGKEPRLVAEYDTVAEVTEKDTPGDAREPDLPDLPPSEIEPGVMFSVMLPNFPGSELLGGRLEKVRPDVIPDSVKADNPEVEARLASARGVERPTLLSRLKELATAAWRGLTRAQQHLPNNAAFARANEGFRQLKNVPDAVSDQANRTLSTIVDPLGPKQLALFERSLIVENQLAALERGEPLRFGFADRAEVEAYKAKLDALVARVPEVKTALATRERVRGTLVAEAVEFGILNQEALANNAYFHQQVTGHLESSRVGGGTIPLRLQRSFQKARVTGVEELGEKYDYNTSYLEAEAKWLTELGTEVAKEKLLRAHFEPYDKLPEVRAEATAKGEKWQKVAREKFPEHEVWSPEPGNLFYRAHTVPEKIAEQLLSAQVKAAGISAKDQREALVVGGLRRPLLIPKELVSQLKDTLKPKPEGVVADASRQLINAWKVFTLFSPKRLVGYMARNLSGDVEPVIAAAPGAVRYTSRAISELRGYYAGDVEMSKSLREARDYGVIGSSLTTQEIPGVRDVPGLKRLYEQEGGLKGLARLPAEYFERVKRFNEFRESVLRYAVYLDYKAKLSAGEKVHYGGAKPEVVDALKKDLGNEAAAAHLARNLLGDYGNLTQFGTWARRHVAPFYSWVEINFKRWPRLAGNAVRDAVNTKDPTKAGVFLALNAARLGALYAAVWAWNNTVMKDEERDLTPEDRASLHLTLGRRDDGSVRVFRRVGSLSDFTDWFGADKAIELAPQYRAGQVSSGNVATEVLKAPLNKAVQAVRPDVKAAFEVGSGQRVYPDVTRPRPADRGELVAGTLGLTDELKALRGEAVGPGYGDRALGLAVVNPGQAAVSEIHDLRQKFMKSRGKATPSASGPPAIAKMRDAAAADDVDAFRQAKEEYIEKATRAGAGKGKVGERFLESLAKMDPVREYLSDADEKRFNEFLTPEQRQRLAQAREYTKAQREKLLKWWKEVK